MTKQRDPGLKPPAPPILLMPREEAVVDGRAVTFRWEPVEGATAYRLEVASDTGFETVVFEQTVSGVTELAVTDAFPTGRTTFFWRVFAQNEVGESLGDVVESFISGSSEDVAQHFHRPDQAERLGPLTELMQEGAREARPSSFRGAEGREEPARPAAEEPMGPAPELLKAAAVQAAAEATGAEAFYEAEEALGVQHEGIGASAILGFVFAVIAVLALAVTFVFFLARDVARQTVSATAAQLDYPDLRETEAKAASKLRQYEVVNEPEQIYRIPIDRAIDLMVNEAYRQPAGEYSRELQLRPADERIF